MRPVRLEGVSHLTRQPGGLLRALDGERKRSQLEAHVVIVLPWSPDLRSKDSPDGPEGRVASARMTHNPSKPPARGWGVGWGTEQVCGSDCGWVKRVAALCVERGLGFPLVIKVTRVMWFPEKLKL